MHEESLPFCFDQHVTVRAPLSRKETQWVAVSFSLFKARRICLNLSCNSCHWLLPRLKGPGQTVTLYDFVHWHKDFAFSFPFLIILIIHFAVLTFNEPRVEKWREVLVRWLPEMTVFDHWLVVWNILAHSHPFRSGWELRLRSRVLRWWIMKADVFRLPVTGAAKTCLLYVDFSTFHIRKQHLYCPWKRKCQLSCMSSRRLSWW